MTKNLLIVNFLTFVATWVLQLRGVDLTQLLGLHFFLASDFHFYQFFTFWHKEMFQAYLIPVLPQP